MQDPRRGCAILAAWLGCAACSFPVVEYETVAGDGGAGDASGDASLEDASRADASDASGMSAGDAQTEASAAEAGQGGSDASASLDGSMDAEAGIPGPALRSASTFAVLAGSTVTSATPSSIKGDLGLDPGTAITGITADMVQGTIHLHDQAAMAAKQDLGSAYDDLLLDTCTTPLTGTNLGQRTLSPGVYCYPDSAADLTGTLTLDAQGDASAVFIFQINGALTTGMNAHVQMMNAGTACNVFWQVGTSATILAGTTFEGSILAATSITLGTSVLVQGRALAESGAVTMGMSTVSAVSCQ